MDVVQQYRTEYRPMSSLHKKHTGVLEKHSILHGEYSMAVLRF